MDGEQLLDPRVLAWLRDGPTSASDWVSRAAIDHARDHPRRATVGVRWGRLIRDLLPGRAAVVSRRLAVMAAAGALLVALAGVGYLAWRQNVVVPPVPTTTASPSPVDSPSPIATFACPPGTNPDQPGPIDQARPERESADDWQTAFEHQGRTVIDAESRRLVLVARQTIWAFDLCSNTWHETASTIADARAPVYDSITDRILFVGSGEITTYDVDTDAVAPAGPTPVVGTWQVAYDSARGLVVARDQETARLWTYDVRADTWREVIQAGDIPPALDDCARWGESVMTYDAAQDRLVLYEPSSCSTPRTYEFDLTSASWERQNLRAPSFGVFDWTGPLLQMAYDENARRSLVYATDELAAYDAGGDAWSVAFSRPILRDTGDYNHYRVPVAYDPANRRTVLVGSDLLGKAGPGFSAWFASDDVTAIDLVTGMTVELLVSAAAQPSLP